MDKNRIIEVQVTFTWSDGTETDMTIIIPPGSYGTGYSSAVKPELGDELKNFPADDNRIAVVVQNQSEHQLQVCFFHSAVDKNNYTVFLLKGVGEEKQGASLMTTTFRHTGPMSINGPEGAMFAAMAYP